MARVPMLSKASAHAEIAQRYREQAKRAARKYPTSKPRTHAALRISELTRLFDDKWGRMFLPESDAGFQAARVMAHHLGRLKDGPRRISAWFEACARWLDMGERERIITEVEECPLRWTADKLAWKFQVTDEQRTRLKLTTIGSIDVPKAERIKRRRQRKRERMTERRRSEGAMPRREYLKSVKKPMPWLAEGVSRATWYRRHRET